MATRPNASFGPVSMDRPVLYSLVERLRAEERLQEFAGALPTRARVSEPVLPLVLAALHERARQRGLVVAARRGRRRARRRRGRGVVPRRRAASRSSRRAACTGPRASSRRRISSASVRARSPCSSGAASSARRRPRSPRACRRSSARPATLDVAPGDEPGIDSLVEQLASAGYERVERVEERGQFAVRGGLVDVFPTTGREPLRIELFGDEIEQIRAFSPFTQRALRQVEHATVYPAAERRSELVELDLGPEEGEEPPPATCPTTSCRRSTRRPTSSGSRTRCWRSGRRSRSRRRPRRRDRADAAAAGPAVLVRRAAAGDRGARARRGRERARRPAPPGARRRRRVPAPRRGAPPAGSCCGASRRRMLDAGEAAARA